MNLDYINSLPQNPTGVRRILGEGWGGGNKSGSLATPAHDGLSIDRLRLLRSLILRSTQGIEALHQAALEARGFVGMDDALTHRFVELADGLHDRLFGFGSVLFECGASLIDSSASGAARGAVGQAAFFVLPIALDLGLYVSQGLPLSFFIDKLVFVPTQERYFT